MFLCLNKKAEICKTGYSEGKLCNVASKYACSVFYLFLKFYSFYIQIFILWPVTSK
jgi:hypothetical protein